jgi:hypothetical protein
MHLKAYQLNYPEGIWATIQHKKKMQPRGFKVANLLNKINLGETRRKTK